MNYFDDKGDLWIEVKAGDLPASLPPGIASGFATLAPHLGNPQLSIAVTTINLSAYIRSLTKPGWVNAALTNTSANIQITSTGGTMWVDDGKPKDAA